MSTPKRPKPETKIDPTLAAQLAALLAQASCSPDARVAPRGTGKRVPADEPEWGSRVRRYVEVKRLLSELSAEERAIKEAATAELERRGGCGALLETLAGDLTLAPGGRNEPAREARYVSWVTLTWLPPGARAPGK
jgi:hypothetical protein